MHRLRIGHGFDVHEFAENRKLMIGGVEVPYERGLLGHSDADVLLHAIADALLGAAGLDDIGRQFPPTDPAYKDADSSGLLVRVLDMITDAGFSMIINVDTIIMAEKPRLNQYVPAMRERIADLLGIEPSRVGIKATTTERLGFVGREEGIAASAVCLIAAHD